jgi:hypothetical protein
MDYKPYKLLTLNKFIYWMVCGLLVFVMACSDSDFAGKVSKKKDKDKTPTSEKKEDSGDLLDEEEEADEPTEIAGAFLVGCGYTAEAVSTEGGAACGCAVLDRATNTKVALDAKFHFTTISTKNGPNITRPISAAKASKNWHGFFACPKKSEVVSFSGALTMQEKKHTFTESKPKHNPENLPDLLDDFVLGGRADPSGLSAKIPKLAALETCKLGGLKIDGKCIYLAAHGESCSDFCSFSSEAENSAPFILNNCSILSKKLGLLAHHRTRTNCSLGCYLSDSLLAPTTCDSYSPTSKDVFARRVCACNP